MHDRGAAANLLSMVGTKLVVVPGGVAISVIGTLAVRVDGRVVPPTIVGSRKARTLLALLAVRRGRLVGLDAIVDALWAGAPSRRSAQDTATLVSRLRSALGTGAVAGGRSGYRLGDQVSVDLDEAARLVRRAEACLDSGDPSGALVAARGALSHVDRGEVLGDQADAAWLVGARAEHSALRRRARHCAAAGAMGAGHLLGARVAAEAALAADPLDELACRILMRACHAAGEPARAVHAYERLRTTLATELGIDPASATRDLYVAILRNTIRRTG